MKYGKIIDGRVVATMQGDSISPAVGFVLIGGAVDVGWTQNQDGTWSKPAEATQPLTKYEFMQRLTATERAQLARLRDTNAALSPDQKDYALADFFELWELVQDVRVDNADTIAGITTIGTALGWSEERIGEILRA